MDKYFHIFRLAAFETIKNYKSLIGLSIFLLTCLLIFAHLWKVAAAKVGALHLQPDELLWYIALNEWVLIAIPESSTDIEQDLRSGRFGVLLPRPISYLGSRFAESLGILAVNLLVLGAVAFLFTWWRSQSFPFDFGSLVFLVALGIFAGALGIVFQMIIGLSAFWLHETSPFQWIWEKLLFTLGGLILPLSLYPLWLQKIANCTPFPTILGQRSALATHFTFGDAFLILLTLLTWGAIGAMGLWFFYRRGLKILNIEGG
jgi:ABC-2 type transport system permease protein